MCHYSPKSTIPEGNFQKYENGAQDREFLLSLLLELKAETSLKGQNNETEK